VVGNLKATFIATEQLSAEFGVNNVADQNYAYEEGFPEPGRNYFANLNLSYEHREQQ
jgi:iron complex outermembrane receptor protein